jgi:hypothetical protein
MEELSKTYTLTHSDQGWRVQFQTGTAPGFGLEPHYDLFEVIGRVETLYPEYRPQLTVAQLADYQIQVTRRGHAQELQKIISQTSDLKDGLIDLTKKLPQVGVSQDREIAEELATLLHQLSDLLAHVEIARREVALAKRVGQPASVVSGQDLARQNLGHSGPTRGSLRSAFYLIDEKRQTPSRGLTDVGR